VAGAMVAVQSVLSGVLGQRVGGLGSGLVLTGITFGCFRAAVTAYPGTARFEALPGAHEWYLYLGGALGAVVTAVLIFLAPRIGATSTLVAIVVGQLTMALVVDHLGLFGSPQTSATWLRILGVALAVLGAVLASRPLSILR
jgi:transporter family-2 protein